MQNKKKRYSFIGQNKHTNEAEIKRINREQIKVEEYRVWFDGDIDEILSYYKSERDRNQKITNGTFKAVNTYTPTFMKLAPVGDMVEMGGFSQINNFTVQHTPVANIITRAKAELLASTRPIITVENDDENGTFQQLLDTIVEENEEGNTLQTIIELASFSGGVALKPILDSYFSEVPLYQVYDRHGFFVHKHYGKDVSIVFMDNYHYDGKDYTLYSEHGKGFISYALTNEDGKEVPLDTLEELSELKDIYFIDKNGKFSNLMTAIYIENKPGFRSDYENVLDDFQSLDETYSKMMDFIRKTTATRIVSENTLKQDQRGNIVVPNAYDSNFLIKWDNTSNVESTNELQGLPDVNNPVQGYINTMDQIYKSIASSVGLSYKTLTSTDAAGANSSETALMFREKADLTTRENMVVNYTNALKKLYKLLISLATVTNIRTEGDIEIYEIFNLDHIDILIEFYNPATPTFEQVIAETTELYNNGLLSHKAALERIWVETGKKSMEEIEEMIREIRGTQLQESQNTHETIKDILEESERDINPEEEDNDEYKSQIYNTEEE